jgi:periplasmic mercuric ion binding protein
MKTFTIFLTMLLMSIATVGLAQTKSETFKVAGECGMCKKKIEKAAKTAGATYAAWNKDTKELTVKYANNVSSTAKIQQAVANEGYDTPGYKATDDAYNNLDGCCQYERASSKTSELLCCENKKCAEEKCMKDGKCAKDMSCCKDNGCDKKDCCKQ